MYTLIIIRTETGAYRDVREFNPTTRPDTVALEIADTYRNLEPGHTMQVTMSKVSQT